MYKEGVSPKDIMLNRKCQVITSDGRIFVGILQGIDQAMNTVLIDCEEKIYSLNEGVQSLQIGLQLIRGDTVAVIGEIDQEIDEKLNYQQIKANPLEPIIN